MAQDLIAPGRLRVGINVQDSETPRIRVVGLNNDDTLEFLERYSADADPYELRFRKARGTDLVPGDVLDQDALGEIRAYGRATTFFETASIRFRVSGAVSAGQRPPSAIEYWTNEDGVAPAVRMRVMPAGNVLVSTDTIIAGENFTVSNKDFSDAAIGVERAVTSSAQPNFRFRKARGTIAVPQLVALDDNLGRINWYAHAGTGGYLETARIEAKVAAATTDNQRPASKLELYTNADGAAPTLKILVTDLGELRAGNPAQTNPTQKVDLAYSDTSIVDGVFRNTSAAAGDAVWEIQVSATGTGDPFLLLSLNTVEDFYIGIDNSDSDLVKMGRGFTVGTTPILTMDLPNENVGIGITPATNRRLHVSANRAGAATCRFENTNASATAHGVIVFAGSNTLTGSDFISFIRPDGSKIGDVDQSAAAAVTYNTTSDGRLKENIVAASPSLALINQIQVREYSFKGHAQRLVGFIAQELYPIFPQAVSVGGGKDCNCDLATKGQHDEDCCHVTPWGVDYGKLTPVLVKAVQELYALIPKVQ